MENLALDFLKKRTLEIGSLCLAGAIWEVIAVLVGNPSLLPGPVAVVRSFFEVIEVIQEDVCFSLLHLGIGLAIAIPVGISTGMIMGWFKRVDRAVDPIIEILRAIPPIAWIPFAILWLHITHQAAGFVIFIGAVFPILINTYSGFRNVKKTHVETAKTLGCTKDKDLLKSVAFPSSLPSIATGIRVGMGVGWMCLIAAEMFGVSRNGLGFRLWHRWHFLGLMDRLLLYMIIIGLIALLLDRGFRYFVEGKLLRWHGGLVT